MCNRKSVKSKRLFLLVAGVAYFVEGEFKGSTRLIPEIIQIDFIKVFFWWINGPIYLWKCCLSFALRNEVFCDIIAGIRNEVDWDEIGGKYFIGKLFQLISTLSLVNYSNVDFFKPLKNFLKNIIRPIIISKCRRAEQVDLSRSRARSRFHLQ